MKQYLYFFIFSENGYIIHHISFPLTISLKSFIKNYHLRREAG
jgi:hypothetical protein